VLVVQGWAFDLDSTSKSLLPKDFRFYDPVAGFNTSRIGKRRRIGDLHDSVIQSFKSTGLCNFVDDITSAPVVAMVVGKELGPLTAKYFFMFLCWDSDKKIFNRLPFEGSLRPARHGVDRVNRVNKWNIDGLKLTRRKMRLG